MEWMLMPYRKLYRLIEGRSTRREFWMFTLLTWIVVIAVIALMVALVGSSVLSMGEGVDPANYGALLAGGGIGVIILMIAFYVWALLTGVASIAVTVRRLHDLNYSGWFLVLFYLVLIGAAAINTYLYLLVVLGGIVVMALPGTAGSNKYDSNDPSQAEVFA